jgi:hypothetical protein
MKRGQRWVMGVLGWMACLLSAAWGQPWIPSGTTIYYMNGNVGVGLSGPNAPFHVQGGSTDPSWQYGTLMVSGGTLVNQLRLGVNTSGTPWGYIQSWVDGVGTQALVLQRAGGNVGIGTTNPGIYKLAVEGTIAARDVMVTNAPFADYVFRPGYRLRPLSEVGAFIRKHGHLPEIPAEGEVRRKGVSLGEMQAKLLAKVEELTLHLIEQEKKNEALLGRLARLEAQVAGK